jgi:ankyrin repeat protein
MMPSDDFANKPTKSGWLPIHYASMAGSYDIVCNLLDVSPECIKATQDEGLLPLHLSVYGSEPCINTLRLLLEKFPGGAVQLSNDGKTPLHVAVDGKPRPSTEAVQILIQSSPEATRIKTKFGKLPLHLCADHDFPCLKTLKVLLDAYPAGALCEPILTVFVLM